MCLRFATNKKIFAVSIFCSPYTPINELDNICMTVKLLCKRNSVDRKALTYDKRRTAWHGGGEEFLAKSKYGRRSKGQTS